MPSVGPFDVFISYSRKDNAGPDVPGTGWITALHDLIREEAKLAGNLPVRPFFDTQDIRGSDDWRHRILQALRDSKILLVCLSPNYFASDYCLWEWQKFVRRQGSRRLQGSGESIQAVRFVEMPGSNAVQNTEWLHSIRRSTTINLAPWFSQPPLWAEQPQARAEAVKVVQAVALRVQQARRALALEYGNLRAATPHFVGRLQELRELHEKVGLQTCVVSAVHGFGGIGKSELAVHYANEYARSYPGGIWWVNAAQYRVSAGQGLPTAIASLIDDLRFPQPSSRITDDNQRFQHVMYHLHEAATTQRAQDPDGQGQVLLILDNVDDPALLSANQRTVLGNAPWLRLLATTRVLPERLHGEDLSWLKLGELSEPDALALLLELRKQADFADDDESAAARRIVQRLGGYTLEIEQAGLYLGAHPHESFAEFDDYLKREGVALPEVIARDAAVSEASQHARQALQESNLAAVLARTVEGLSDCARALLAAAVHWHHDTLPLPWLEELTPPLQGPVTSSHAPAWQELESRRLVMPTAEPELRRMHQRVWAYLQAQADADLPEPTAALIDREQAQLEHDSFRQAVAPWRIDALRARATGPGPQNRQRALALVVLANWTLPVRGASTAAALADASLRLSEHLLRADPSSALAKRDVSASLNNVGQIKAWQGDAAGALLAYQRMLDITEALALADPSSAQAKRDLVVSHSNLWQIATERTVEIHHAREIDRILSTLKAGSAHIAPRDQQSWDNIKQWLKDNER